MTLSWVFSAILAGLAPAASTSPAEFGGEPPTLTLIDPLSDTVVTLSTQSRIRSVQGNLVGMVDEFLIVETDLGVMKIRAADVVCEGRGCPEFQESSGAFSRVFDLVAQTE